MKNDLIDIDIVIKDRIVYLSRKLPDSQSLAERLEELFYIKKRIEHLIQENVDATDE